jgi:hypothetical protein
MRGHQTPPQERGVWLAILVCDMHGGGRGEWEGRVGGAGGIYRLGGIVREGMLLIIVSPGFKDHCQELTIHKS